jgi:hypothetical protein
MDRQKIALPELRSHAPAVHQHDDGPAGKRDHALEVRTVLGVWAALCPCRRIRA